MMYHLGAIIWLAASGVALARGVYWSLFTDASFEATHTMGWAAAICFLVACVIWANRPQRAR